MDLYKSVQEIATFCTSCVPSVCNHDLSTELPVTFRLNWTKLIMVDGSSPDEVLNFFSLPNPSSRSRPWCLFNL
jgi:hypothetical protein